MSISRALQLDLINLLYSARLLITRIKSSSFSKASQKTIRRSLIRSKVVTRHPLSLKFTKNSLTVKQQFKPRLQAQRFLSQQTRLIFVGMETTVTGTRTSPPIAPIKRDSNNNSMLAHNNTHHVHIKENAKSVVYTAIVHADALNNSSLEDPLAVHNPPLACHTHHGSPALTL